MRILAWGLEEKMSMKAVQLSPHYKTGLLYAKISTRGKGISMVWLPRMENFKGGTQPAIFTPRGA